MMHGLRIIFVFILGMLLALPGRANFILVHEAHAAHSQYGHATHAAESEADLDIDQPADHQHEHDPTDHIHEGGSLPRPAFAWSPPGTPAANTAIASFASSCDLPLHERPPKARVFAG
jgi:hypothetical protein